MKVMGIILASLYLISACMGQIRLEISDSGWRMIPDTAATWENDPLYLPDEVNLSHLPVNPPSGGWEVLNPSTGSEVILPSTVEQHYWGKFGFRDYGKDCYFGPGIDQSRNGNYRGVSWWWREIDIPESWKNKKIILHVRGARLRAEVYLNRQLTGYHIIAETAFTCDLTEAAIPGEKNLLAVRITNPGGQMDWMDTRYLEWGNYRFHSSHGFGGLDRGFYVTAHDPVYINNFWVLNKPKRGKIRAGANLINKSDSTLSCELTFTLWDKENENLHPVAGRKSVTISAVSATEVFHDLEFPDAVLWSSENPRLYRLILTLRTDQDHIKWEDRRSVTFGFRWFEADGIGVNAVLCFNSRRIRLVSAISWGFWGLNGLFPTPVLAEKEVLAAKTFGMNCLNFHRNIGKTEVLDAQDRLGLLRIMEAGGGQTALGESYSLYAPSPIKVVDISGKDGDAESFAEKYMEEKIIRMIRDHRSHPSLLMYNIQNEIHPDLQNPRIFRLLRRMHGEDPSRIITLKSGIPPQNQAWMKPYDATVYYDDGSGYSGWWDRHTVGGPGAWQDNLYKNPDNFTHNSLNDSEVVAWGEMLGAAVPDNHEKMIDGIKALGGKSYDLKDHVEILQAYNEFLDRWKFRDAFPTAGDLFMDIGNKCYDFWGRVIETARLAEANDFLVISGWESTAIENHSGLLDNLRQFKGNPELLSKRLASFRPVIKSRALVIPMNGNAVLDLYLLNETGATHGNQAELIIISPSGETLFSDSYTVPSFKKDRFVYPISDSVATPELNMAGEYILQLKIEGHEGEVCQEKLLVIDPFKKPSKSVKVGMLVHEPDFIRKLNKFPGIEAAASHADASYDLLVVSTRLLYGWRSEVDANTEIAGTEDDVLYHTESWGYYRNLEYVFSRLPEGKAKVTLRFAEVTLKNPGDRIMNVAINGDTVLSEFDIVAETGAPNIALDTVFMVDSPDGTVRIKVPKLTVNYAKFSAIKVEAGDTVIAINCGGEEYRDKDGLMWKKYQAKLNLDNDILDRVKAGTPLLLLPDGSEAVEAYARLLGAAGAFKYLGHTGNTRASWMGSWYFLREHPVFAGLPVNQAMKSYYQAPVHGTEGILLEGKNVRVFAGYGRDHDRNIGAAAFTVKLGKGKILFFTLPGMISGLIDEENGMQPIMLKRILSNSIDFLFRHK